MPLIRVPFPVPWAERLQWDAEVDERFADGLQDLFLLGQGAVQFGPGGAVSARQGTFAAAMTEAGAGLSFSSAAIQTPPPTIYTGGVTALAVVVPTIVDANPRSLIHRRNISTIGTIGTIGANNSGAWVLNQSSTGIGWGGWQSNNTTAWNTGTSVVLPVGRPSVVAATARGTGLETSIFLNGEKVGGNTQTGALHNTTGFWTEIGGRTGGNNARYFGGAILLSTHWFKDYTDEDLADLTANPGLLLRERSIWVPVSAAGGGGGVVPLTGSLSAAVQAGRVATASVAAALQQARTANAALQLAASTSRTATSAATAALQQARLAAAAFQLGAQAPRSAGGAVSAALQKEMTPKPPAELSTAVQAGRTSTAALSAQVQAGSQAAASLSAAVRQTRQAAAAASLAAAAQRAASAAASATVQQRKTASSTLTAYLQAGFTTSAALSVVARQAKVSTAGLSSALQVRRSVSAAVAAVLTRAGLTSSLVQAALMARRTSTASLGVYVQSASDSLSTFYRYSVPAFGKAYSPPAFGKTYRIPRN